MKFDRSGVCCAGANGECHGRQVASLRRPTWFTLLSHVCIYFIIVSVKIVSIVSIYSIN